MIRIGRPSRPKAKTDMQGRLEYIMSEMKILEAETDKDKVIERLVWGIDYLAALLFKHLNSGQT